MRLMLTLAATILLGTSVSADEPKIDVKTYTYKSVDDLDIHADVYRLPDTSPGPAIVLIHGGALIMGDRDMLRNEVTTSFVRQLLGAGFTVVSIDYRLAPETKLPAIIDDLKDAFRWVKDAGPREFGVDPKRIAAVGHSAGGYLTLMAGCCVDPPPKALVSFYGYGDITADWYAKPDEHYRTTARLVSKDDAWAGVGTKAISGASFFDESAARRGSFYLYCRQNGRWCNEVAGMDATSQKDELAPYCPQLNVTDKFPPTLLIHGTTDTDVPYEQSVAMAAELKRLGVPHELVTLNNFGHGFEWSHPDAPEVKDANARAIAFLKERLAE